MTWKLKPHPSFAGVKGPVVVCVMDGVGVGRSDESDAVWLARTPNLDRLARTSLSTQLAAHGTYVGMPGENDMGNSEVGHNALGAGRIFDQGAKLVGNAIASGLIYEGEVWQRLLTRARESGKALHFLGLLSDGNVHSHIEHLFAMLRRCDFEEVEKVRLHLLLDGRDVAETNALDYVDALEELLETLRRKGKRDYRVASGGGRMLVTMDRYEADWGMVELGWKTHVLGEGRRFASAREAIATYRVEDPGLGDQYLPPFVIAGEDGQAAGPIRDGETVIFFNYRGDRGIEISQAFEDDHFESFDRGHRPDVLYAGMMQYDGDLQIPSQFLVSPPDIDRTLGEYLARNDVPQLAVSETQKYGHVTYFWNGNRSGRFDDRNETYVEIPGDNLPFEERPWMKAAEITDCVLGELASGRQRHVRLNFANGDMVGHTGHRDAAVIAVEAVDHQIGRLMPMIEKQRGALVVTADHGNADCMFEFDKKTGEPKTNEAGLIAAKTSHTLNPVPLYIYAPGEQLALARRSLGQSGLGNVAATLLQLLGFRAPEDYLDSLLD
jgi:2,3-bisphosphoglycerate-independent phosphoglycerate mutase